VARIMLSIWAFGGLLLGAAASQVILTLFSRRHTDNYCLANRTEVGVADDVDGDNIALRHVVIDHIDTGACLFND
jgi:hypothetical protein